MRDRRGATRYRCQLRCILGRGKGRQEATVLDLSNSGLSIRTTLDLGQGDEVEVLIEPDLHFQAIAWRTTRTRNGLVVGMMLSHACAEFEALVERHAARTPAATARSAQSNESLQTPSSPRPRHAELWWRLRVKDGDGNRTRVVAIVATSREDAIAGVLAEIGGGWEILEAELDPRAPAKKKASGRNP
jgi:hypothetical protein